MIKSFLIKSVVFITSFLERLFGFKISDNKEKNEKVYVNLGCGLRCLPGWINIDGSLTALFGSSKFSFINKILYKLAGASKHYSFQEYNEILKRCPLHFYDLRYGIPLKDEAVDVVYSSHFLEHLNKEDGEKLIKETYLILKRGGLLRIVVPDLDIALAMYQEGKVNEMLDLFFCTSDRYNFNTHKYNYNYKTIKILLMSVGFRIIEKKSYQRGDCPAISFLDLYPKHSIYVEARK